MVFFEATLKREEEDETNAKNERCDGGRRRRLRRNDDDDQEDLDAEIRSLGTLIENGIGKRFDARAYAGRRWWWCDDDDDTGWMMMESRCFKRLHHHRPSAAKRRKWWRRTRRDDVRRVESDFRTDSTGGDETDGLRRDSRDGTRGRRKRKADKKESQPTKEQEQLRVRRSGVGTVFRVCIALERVVHADERGERLADVDVGKDEEILRFREREREIGVYSGFDREVFVRRRVREF